MGFIIPKSQITFLYFEDMEKCEHFFQEILELELAYKNNWSSIWKITESAFIGAVNLVNNQRENKNKDMVLVSFTVDNLEDAYEHIKKNGAEYVTPIHRIESMNMKSFFVKCPECYTFEIQQFDSPELASMFQ